MSRFIASFQAQFGDTPGSLLHSSRRRRCH